MRLRKRVGVRSVGASAWPDGLSKYSLPLVAALFGLYLFRFQSLGSDAEDHLLYEVGARDTSKDLWSLRLSMLKLHRPNFRDLSQLKIVSQCSGRTRRLGSVAQHRDKDHDLPTLLETQPRCTAYAKASGDCVL